MDLKYLKSGTDVRGTALPGYGEEVNLTPEIVRVIARAFCALIMEKNPTAKVVAVGHDSRLSAESLSEALIGGLVDCGATVLSYGLASTPAMFMSTAFDETKADAAIMITASHLHKSRNGLKFYFPDGGMDGRLISRLLDYAEKGNRATLLGEGRVITGDYMERYCRFLCDKMVCELGEKPLTGMKIVVDASNGAGGFFAHRVLSPLGADVNGSVYLEPDGAFPNHAPNPEDATAIAHLKAAVQKVGADLGIIFDTDVDRAAFVDGEGREINRNRLIALLSAMVLRDNPGAYIVTDSVTSDGLSEFIKARGGVHHRFKRGYKNVIDEAIRLRSLGLKAPLAIETSGHVAFEDNFYLDDGAFAAVSVIIEAVRGKGQGVSLGILTAEYNEAAESREIRLKFRAENYSALGAFIIERLKDYGSDKLILAKTNYEGVRFSVPALRGWFLLRMSLHDPVMVINIESDVEGGSDKIVTLLYAYLSAFEPDLDCSALKGG